MRSIIVVLCTALGMSVVAFSAYGQMKGRPAVIDGDTLSFNIRIFGIDTPEKQQRCEKDGACYLCGQDAKRHLETFVKDKDVTCTFTGAITYGRPVGSCAVNGEDIGERMINDGWALPYERYLKGQLKERYLAAADAAKLSRSGMHAGPFIPPEKWRRGERLACER